jgi:hypothetical protein
MHRIYFWAETELIFDGEDVNLITERIVPSPSQTIVFGDCVSDICWLFRPFLHHSSFQKGERKGVGMGKVEKR